MGSCFSEYLIAIIALTIVTCAYTAAGGIKAVIWTDVIQACLMFGSALVAAFTLLSHIGGWEAVVRHVPAMAHTSPPITCPSVAGIREASPLELQCTSRTADSGQS